MGCLWRRLNYWEFCGMRCLDDLIVTQSNASFSTKLLVILAVSFFTKRSISVRGISPSRQGKDLIQCFKHHHAAHHLVFTFLRQMLRHDPLGSVWGSHHFDKQWTDACWLHQYCLHLKTFNQMIHLKLYL